MNNLLRKRMSVILKSGVDLLACETIPCKLEAGMKDGFEIT